MAVLTLPSIMLVMGFLAVMRAVRYSGYGIALLSLCATALHEACHWLCGALLNAKPVSVSLWPKRHGSSWVLGSVSFTNINVWNAAFVAFAPLAMLPLGYALFELWLVPAFLDGAYLSWLVAGYVVACCIFACLPSSTDIKLGAGSAIMYAVIGYAIYAITGSV